MKLGTVALAHAFNSNTQKTEAGHLSEASLVYTMEFCLELAKTIVIMFLKQAQMENPQQYVGEWLLW